MGFKFIEQPIQVEEIENMKVLKGLDLISLMIDENRSGSRIFNSDEIYDKKYLILGLYKFENKNAQLLL